MTRWLERIPADAKLFTSSALVAPLDLHAILGASIRLRITNTAGACRQCDIATSTEWTRPGRRACIGLRVAREEVRVDKRASLPSLHTTSIHHLDPNAFSCTEQCSNCKCQLPDRSQILGPR